MVTTDLQEYLIILLFNDDFHITELYNLRGKDFEEGDRILFLDIHLMNLMKIVESVSQYSR
jgi:hypothetical protein